ncbi:hypothetical protein Sar04_31260 [Salinispora arenicola]|uniref:Uncharacterized protein n=1 Tax=Salinispora arenicola TaxID=168697 RepID=A0ABQ4JTT4_SALAC|nr:hypothetical protein Sar04_31260 [Salinispora arenicola]
MTVTDPLTYAIDVLTPVTADSPARSVVAGLQVTRDLGDRLPGFAHDPHRSRAEPRIEPASRLSHEPLSLRS